MKRNVAFEPYDYINESYEWYLMSLCSKDFLTLGYERDIRFQFSSWMEPYEDESYSIACVTIRIEEYPGPMCHSWVVFTVFISASQIINWSEYSPLRIIKLFRHVMENEDFIEQWRESEAFNFYCNNPDENLTDSAIWFDLQFPENVPFIEIINQMVKPRIKKLFRCIEKEFQEQDSNLEKVNLKLAKDVRTAFKQYLVFFNEFVEATKSEEIFFEVQNHPDGLEIQFEKSESGKVKEYLHEYLSLLTISLAGEPRIPISFSDNSSAETRNKFVLEMQDELENFRKKLVRNKRLKSEIKQLRERIDFLKDELDSSRRMNEALAITTKNQSEVLASTTSKAEIRYTEILRYLYNAVIALTGRKDTHPQEDLLNDLITDWLRNKGYDKNFSISDQTRNGISKKGAGELDIAIRTKEGSIFTIIEAFRLKSCGAKDTNVSYHIDKLLYNYDKAGNQANFILVYSEAKNFNLLWKNYFRYVSDLNNKKGFRKKYPLLDFHDTNISDKTNIKIGLATYEREGSEVKVYHIVFDMMRS